MMIVQARIFGVFLYFIIFLLRALPLTLTATLTSGQSVNLIPLSESLSFGFDSSAEVATPDPRAVLLAAHLKVSIEQLQQTAIPATAHNVMQRSVNSGTQELVVSSVKTDSTASGSFALTAIAPGDIESTLRFSTHMATGGTVRALKALPNQVLEPSKGNTLSDNEATARSFLSSQRALIGLEDPDSELTFRKFGADSLNHRHLRFSQSFKGLPVWGAELIAQIDEVGNLISVNGAYGMTPQKLVTRPTVSKEQALSKAQNLHQTSVNTEPELVIFLKDQSVPHLAWHIPLAVSPLEQRIILVDAHDNSILIDYNQVQSTSVSGSGVDLFGETQSLNLWFEDNYYHLVDASKAMFDETSDPPSPWKSRGVITILDALNTPSDINTEHPTLYYAGSYAGPSSGFLPAAVSAATNFSKTYDYFLEKHNRNSLDNAGGNITAVVRLGLLEHVARYNPGTSTMYFGDASPYAGALDVVAHEFTHGVVHNTANLVYQGQSGALNESFADIFGEMVEAYANGQNDWLMGTSLGQIIRSMSNPALYNDPAHMANYVVTSSDNGGVHTNSGIPNHAFYQLAVGLPNAIGIENAAKIFYRSLTTKLTARAEFVDARVFAIQSAEELFGVGSIQAQTTTAAFDAVGIFDTLTNSAPPPYTGTTGEDGTLFTYWNSIDQKHYLGRYEPSLGDSAIGRRIVQKAITPKKSAVMGDGTVLVFIDSEHDVCATRTDGSEYGEEVCLGYPGLVHSVAMSPGGTKIGFVFLDSLTGEPENKINVIDIDTGVAQTFSLNVPIYDGDVTRTVVEADTMDFSADNRYLIYDAFNELKFQDGTTMGLWSIYAIDLFTNGIISVIPPITFLSNNQRVGINAGYPSFAQTSDRHLIFDLYHEAGNEGRIYAGDWHSGALTEVANTQNWSFPGWTGDDSGIVYSSKNASVSTGFSLIHQPVLSDRVSKTGSLSTWIDDAMQGVVYKRGSFSGPKTVDLKLTQSKATQAGHLATFTIQINNQGPDAASSIEIVDTLPTNITILSTTLNGTCSNASGKISCTISSIPVNSTETITIEVKASKGMAITNSVTAFASEPDKDSSDNTTFITVDAGDMNNAPVVSSQGTATQTRAGSFFSLNAFSNFSDADNDELTYSATGLPSGLSLNTTTAMITGTPTTAAVSATAYSIQVTATDGTGENASTQFSLTVNAALPPSTSNPSSGGGGGGGCTISRDGGHDSTLPILLLICALYFIRQRYGPTKKISA